MSKKHNIPKIARRYQWYTGYSRNDEYEKNPQWAADMNTEVEETDEEEDVYTKTTITFYDKFEPQKMWITSDTTRDLTNTL